MDYAVRSPGLGHRSRVADREWISSPIWRFLYEQQSTAGETSSPLDGPTIVIMSWHTARLDDRWDQVAPFDRVSNRSRDDIPASCRGRDYDAEDRMGVWDAVLVDEAHNARCGSNFYALDDIAVTFSAECTDEFPSVQYLAPGHSLLSQLLTILQNRSEESTRFDQRIATRPDQETKPIVCGWGRDGVFTRIADDGTVTENGPMDDLPSWCDRFLENRDKST